MPRLEKFRVLGFEFRVMDHTPQAQRGTEGRAKWSKEKEAEKLGGQKKWERGKGPSDRMSDGWFFARVC